MRHLHALTEVAHFQLPSESRFLEALRVSVEKPQVIQGDLRFPNFSDVTTKLNKHVRNQFVSGRPLLDSSVSDRVAQYFGLKLNFKRVRRARLEAEETEMLDSSKPEVTYVTSMSQTPCKLIG